MEHARNIRNLALVGFMGAGKSTVGRLVAARLRFDYLDTDDCIESKVGKPIPKIFAEDGEDAFRREEGEVVRMLADRRETVISTGGGLVANPGCLESLKTHALVVCLWVSAETVWQRVGFQSHRPLLQTPDPLARIRQLLDQREPYYRQADVLLNTEHRSPRQIAQLVITQFQSAALPPAVQ